MHNLRMKIGKPRLLALMSLCCIACVVLVACGGSTGGGNWQASNVTKQSLLTIAVNPNNPQKIYAAGEQGSIIASTDGGNHWQVQSTGLVAPDVVHALGFNKTGTQLYAATDRGLLVSRVGSNHWSTLTSSSLPTDHYTALAFDLNSANVLYLGTAQHGVLVSHDAGMSWQRLAQGLPAGLVVNGLSYDTDAHLLWAATSLGIYRLNTKGTTWQALNTGIPAGLVVNTVVPASVTGGSPNLIYAGTRHGFYRSQDNGAHWSSSQDSLVGVSVNAVLRDYRTNDSQQVYAGTSAGVLLSDDLGQTWQGVAGGIPRGISINALAIGGTNAGQILAVANTIYLYPGYGSNSGSGSNIGAILIFVAFFFLLYYISQRGRRRRIQRLRSTRESKDASTAPSPESKPE